MGGFCNLLFHEYLNGHECGERGLHGDVSWRESFLGEDTLSGRSEHEKSLIHIFPGLAAS